MILNILILSTIIVCSVSGDSPDYFSWDNYNNTSFLGIVQNQNFPASCNSGWAFSTINVLNMRAKIKRKAESPDLSLSPQVLLSCDTLDYGCLGGQPLTALKWIAKNNITDESCHAYKAKGYTNGESCNSAAKCQSCSNGQCKAIGNSKVYSIHKYGSLSGENEMMEEIKTFGPIACGISGGPLNDYIPDTILNSNKSKKIDHFVTVFGWNVTEDGDKYWLVRNSWGPNWGNSGNFKIKKGENILGIQQRCVWASVRDTWTNDIRNKTLPNLEPISQKKSYFPSEISYSLGEYLTPSRNYLTPNTCKTAWAFSIIQMLADRQNKQTKGKIPITLSAQVLLNCGVGSCSKGGNPLDALVFLQKYGLPQEGCQTYQAQSPDKQSCSAINNCATCKGTAFKSECVESKNYKRWKIYDFGSLSGIEKMKNEIFSWGPIICGMHASNQFQAYKGGIFSEISISPKTDHYVEVLGWGEENGKKYWICRNFWGTTWGESSFFRIQMESNNLGIENKCYFGNSLM